MARPREFDVEHATDLALQVFWEKGYEGTTLTDLTDAMGIARPSLYAAFGNKEGLFRRALARYVANMNERFQGALGAPTAREAVERILRFYADAAGRQDCPKGCLLVQGALASGDESADVRAALAEERAAMESAITARLEQAKRDGDLPGTVRPADLARYVVTVANGMAVQAAGGATRAELRRVADTAMLAWPAA